MMTHQTDGRAQWFMRQVRSEWLKLTRRPMTWVLLGIFLAQMVLFLSLNGLVVGMSDGMLGEVRIEVVSAEQIEQFRLRTRFPGLFGEVLGLVNGVGGFLAVILAAGTIGSEYSWGTLRLQLARQPQRGRYLSAKIVTLLLVIFVGILIALVVGCIVGWGESLMLGNSGTITISDLAFLPVAIFCALYVLLPYILFTIAIGILGRSLMASLAGGILFITIDASTGISTFLAHLETPLIRLVMNLLVQQNVNALVFFYRQGFGLAPSVGNHVDPTLLPSPLQAVFIIAAYSGIFLAYAYFLFQKRDVLGAS